MTVRGWKTLVLPIILLLISIVSWADVNQTLTMTVDRKADLSIDTGAVDLGTIQGAVGSQYYEKLNAARVSFHCNLRTNWEVRLSGTDFSAGANTIPITRLLWKKASTAYTAMPLAGRYTVIASNGDYPGHGANWHDEDISFRLNLTGDEYEGTYRATLTYTLFVP